MKQLVKDALFTLFLAVMLTAVIVYAITETELGYLVFVPLM